MSQGLTDQSRRDVTTLQPQLLNDGSNTIVISAIGDVGVPFDMIAFDSFVLEYPSRFIYPDNPNSQLQFRASGERFEVGSLPTVESLAVYRVVDTVVQQLAYEKD